jgi:hypothetical protein
MKPILVLMLIAAASAGDRKPLPGQAGNDDVELVGSVIIDRDEIEQALGADMGQGYVMARIKVTPKTEKALHISSDDFTMIDGKDGQRCQALSPGQIAGKGALVVKAAPNQPGGLGTRTNGPIWGGIGPVSTGTRSAPPPNPNDAPAPHVESGNKDEKDSPLLAALKAKGLPDADSLEPVEGFLYFAIDGKFKPKDLRIIYQGQAGKLIVEFENPKKK